MTQGERVKYLRKELHLTLEKFGIPLGVGKTAISKVEKGENNLSPQMIELICSKYNVNEDWLRNGEGEPFVKRTRNEEIEAFFQNIDLGSDDFKSRFVSMLSHLNAEEWKVLEKMAREIVDGNLKPESQEDSRPAGTPEGVAEAEAAYEEALGFAPSIGSSVSSIGGEEKKEA